MTFRYGKRKLISGTATSFRALPLTPAATGVA